VNPITALGYNADLKWETTTTYNVGFDFGFLKDRITMGLDAYWRETTDMINYIPVPALGNLTNYLNTNIGSLENKGIEFEINAMVIDTKDWTWSIGGNVAYNNTEITKLTATANEGYVFLSWNDGNTENPRVVSLTSDTSFVANFALIDESSLLEAEAESISFFPNPTKSEITFSQAIEKVEVIDLTGKAILTFSNAKTINIESLPAGAYYLRLTNDEKTSLQKVIKQ
jgi:hypothetical protein